MNKLVSTALAAAIAVVLSVPVAKASGESVALPDETWSFEGMFGTFDQASAQRGWQVYKEVCHSCHGLRLIAFRHLTGIGLTPAQVEAQAAEFQATFGPNDEGEMFQAPARPFNTVPSPFPNEAAARVANNGAYPPDLSLIVEARKNGANYLYGLLVGYHDEPPAGVELMSGMYYNQYFPGHQIAMPPPLTDDRVTYADGTQATVSQMARDLTTFLAWAAEPNLVERRQLGIKTLLFLIVLTAMLYALKRKIWADVH